MPPVKAGPAFWRWLVNKLPALRASVTRPDPDEALLDEIVERLHAVDERLYFLAGGDSDGPALEFIVTAEGDLSAFPVVERLVGEAPTVPGWVFVAFKQAHGCDFVTRHEGASIDAASAWFQPLLADGELGLRLACASYHDDLEEAYQFAAVQVLDGVLGEFVAARVDYVEVVKTPRDPAGKGFRPVAQLPEYLVAIGAAARS